MTEQARAEFCIQCSRPTGVFLKAGEIGQRTCNSCRSLADPDERTEAYCTNCGDTRFHAYANAQVVSTASGREDRLIAVNGWQVDDIDEVRFVCANCESEAIEYEVFE